MNIKKIDVLKIVAYFKVYGCDIYAKKHLGLDTGKNNLESYFCRGHHKWTKHHLQQVVTFMTRECILNKEKGDPSFTPLSLSYLYKPLLSSILN